VLSGLVTGASWTCHFRALKVGDASTIAPLGRLSLLLAVLITLIFLGKPPSQEWMGVLMIRPDGVAAEVVDLPPGPRPVSQAARACHAFH
jgi:uncharacterized membrane protein